MSELKRTPGEWVTHYDDDFDIHSVRLSDEASVRYVEICEISSGDKHRASDADLIAAAPELYEALVVSNAMLRELMPPDVSVRETLARNEALLAKARGEQS